MISSNFNLVIVNLWIGLCRGVAGLPRFFKEHRYEVLSIERTFSNQDAEKVCPEILVCSPELKHTIMIESKSGPNTEQDQLRRYSRVTELDLKRQGNVPSDSCDTFDCAIIGLAEFTDRLKIGINVGNYTFPLLVADVEGMALVHNQFTVAEVSNVFSPIMEIEWDRVPLGFIPIDTSSADWEVAEVVIPQILALMHAGATRVASEEICSKIFSLWWQMGKDGRNQMLARVDEIFKQIAEAEFSEYFQQPGKGQLRIVKSPLDMDPPRASAEFRRFARAQEAFLDRLRTGQLEMGLGS